MGISITANKFGNCRDGRNLRLLTWDTNMWLWFYEEFPLSLSRTLYPYLIMCLSNPLRSELSLLPLVNSALLGLSEGPLCDLQRHLASDDDQREGYRNI